MAIQPVYLKRSATPGKIPTTSDLSLGEVGINTFDGKAYIKKNDGAESIVELGSGGYSAPEAIALYNKDGSGVTDAFDGAETRFQLRNSSGDVLTVPSALSLAISINGVMQEPNEGTPGSFDGFYVTVNSVAGADIVFSAAPSSTDEFFGVLGGIFSATGGTSAITYLDDISGDFDGVETDFSITKNGSGYTPQFSVAVLVVLGGVVQIPGDAYTISGSTISFADAPPTGTSFHAVDFKIGPSAVETVYDGDVSGTSNNLQIKAGVITDNEVSTSAEIAVSKLANGAAHQLLQTDAAGTGVEWTDNVDVPGTLDVTGAATLDSTLSFPLGTAALPSLYPGSDTNTGIYSPGADQLAISTNGAQRLLIDASGNVTLNAQSDLRFADSDSSNWVAFQGPATVASNVTWTLPSADGTASQVLSTDGSGTLSWATAAGGATDKIEEGNTSAEVIDTGSDGRFVVTTEGSERARIDSSGRLLVGTSTARSNFFNAAVFSAALQLEGTGTQRRLSITGNEAEPYLILARETSGSVGGNTIVSNGDVAGAVSFQGSDGGQFVETAKIEAIIDGTPGTNDMPGRIVLSTTADGAVSPTERMRITSDGDFLIEKTAINQATQGFQYDSGGAGLNATVTITNTRTDFGAGPFRLNRQGSDGTLIHFLQAATEEGAISVSGSTVTYGGGHLARWSQLPNDEDPSGILKGTVLSNLDEMCEWEVAPRDEVLWEEGDELPEGVNVGDVKEPAYAGGFEDNEQLNRIKVSDVEGDPNVAGVFVSTSFSDDGPLDFFCAMTGDMIIRIAEGVTVARGDLLMSAGDGTAKPQDDDIIRSKTIAKVTSTHVTCTYDDGSYCVPCVLMAC